MINIKSKSFIKFMFYFIVFYFLLFSILYAQEELTPSEIFTKYNDAVVVVLAYKDNTPLGQGSGVVINDEGWVVTNYHNYSNKSYKANRIVIKHLDEIIEQTDILGFDIKRDIILLKMKDNISEFPYIPIGNSDNLQVGENVCVIGSPLGYENTLSCGIISGLGRIVKDDNNKFIQMTASIQRGSSGGAVINMKGELIGISTLGYESSGDLYFAIPINDVFVFYLKQYEKEIEPINYFNEGINALNILNYSDAIYYFTKHLEINIDDYEAYFYRGGVYRALNDNERALADFTKAIELKPDYYAAYCGCGYSNYFLKEYQKAIEDFTKVIELNKYELEPWYSSAHNGRGFVYFDLKEYDKAIEDFTKAIESSKIKQPEAYNGLGLVYLELKEYNKAIEEFTKAIELEPNYSEAFYNRGLAYDKLKMYKKARNDFKKSEELKKKK